MEPFEPPSDIQYEPPMNRRQNQGIPEPPLDDPDRTMGLVTAIIRTVQQVYFSPQDFFRGIRDDRSPVPAVLWAVALYSLGGIIQNFFNYLSGANDAQFAQFNAMFQQLLGQSGSSLSPDEFMKTVQILTILLVPIFSFLVLFMMVILHFIAGKVLGIAERSFDVYLRVVSYSFTAYMINLIPFNFLVAFSPVMAFPVLAITLFMVVHYVALIAIGFKVTDPKDATLFRPVLVAIGPFILCCCFIAMGSVLFAAMISAATAGGGGG